MSQWAVLSYDNQGAWNFAKIIGQNNGKIFLRLFEKEYEFTSESENNEGADEVYELDSKYLKLFNSPVKMLAYLLVHQRLIVPPYDKKSIIKSFLLRFPSERTNLERLLTQSQAKCTESTSTPYRRIDAMEPGYSEAND